MDVLGIVNDYKEKLKEFYKKEQLWGSKKRRNGKSKYAVLYTYLVFIGLCCAGFITVFALYLSTATYSKLKIGFAILLFIGMIFFIILECVYIINDYKKTYKNIPKYNSYLDKLGVLDEVLGEYKISYNTSERINTIINEIIEYRDRNKENRFVFSLFIQIFSLTVLMALTLPFQYKIMPYDRGVVIALLMLFIEIGALCFALIVAAYVIRNAIMYIVNKKYNDLISCLRLFQVFDIEETKKYIKCEEDAD